jgi:hypothetical protein
MEAKKLLLDVSVILERTVVDHQKIKSKTPFKKRKRILHFNYNGQRKRRKQN